MKYQNVKTGVIIDVTSKLGGDWVPVTKAPSKPKPEEEPQKEETPKKAKKGTAKK